MRNPFFQVTGLHVNAGEFKLQNISFSLDREEYLIVLGPTGCGKTILLETLAGLRKPVSGRIYLENNNITGKPPEDRGFGFAYQDSLLYPFLNIRENILLGAKARKMHKDSSILKRLERLTEAMGISHLLQRFPVSLSGGERQRVSLARSILISPPILLLDEPLSSLDPQTRHSMQLLLRELHNSEEFGIIHVTHDFQEALDLGSKVIVMKQGEILQQGNTLDVFYQPLSISVADFIQSENLVKGKIEKINGIHWFRGTENNCMLGPLPKNLVVSREQGEVYLMLQSGRLEVSASDQSPYRKPASWDAFIKRVAVKSTHVELICIGNGSWHTALSRNEWEKLALKEGAKITLSVDLNDLHLICA